MPDGVLVCDARGRITYVNPRLEELSGHPRADLIGRPVEFLVPEGMKVDHRGLRTRYMRRPRTRPMGGLEGDFRLLRRDGTELPVDISLASVRRSGVLQVIATVRDITARRDLEARLAHMALHDPLTGLANRTLFVDRFNQAILQGRRERRQVAVVMLDLDHLKAVNDTYGHQAGDRVLQRVARGLSAGLRATDTVARIGGDEFAWVLPGVGGRQAAMVMMAKLLKAVPARVGVGDRQIEVGVSAGLALFPDDGEDLDTLMRVADVQLYAAKRRAPVTRYSV
jgi:diguanylate cyclase (GGDEF)-like protein/PAS domain S-box-containing protein